MTSNRASAESTQPLCPLDGRPVPPQRKRFCSAKCATQFKRAQMRAKREKQHRHCWRCIDCGKRTKLGRRMIVAE